jgi:hypothetical protein
MYLSMLGVVQPVHELWWDLCLLFPLKKSLSPRSSIDCSFRDQILHQLLLSSAYNALAISYWHFLEPDVFSPFVETGSVSTQSGRIINTALIDQSAILSVSSTAMQYHPPAPIHSLKA